MSFNHKRFARYVQRDRLNKVKKYIKTYGASIIEVPLDEKKRTAVHLACKYSSGYCLQRFLKYKLRLNITDEDGNLPLHLILLKEHPSKRDYTDIVQPLMDKCSPSILRIENNKGQTPIRLLSNTIYFKYMTNEACRIAIDDDSTDEESRSSDESWNEKLLSCFADDCEDLFGKYENDYDYGTKETYDEWADRISSEYFRKRNEEIPSSSKKKPENTARQQYKELKPEKPTNYTVQRMRFEAQTKRVYSKEEISSIHLNDLPWISIHSEELLLSVLLCGIDRSDSGATKKCLKEHLIQWHPDKFYQKCGHRLDESDKKEVLTAVNTFSQTINAALQKGN